MPGPAPLNLTTLVERLTAEPLTLAQIADCIERSEKTATRALADLRGTHKITETVEARGRKLYQITGRTKGHWPRGKRRNADAVGWSDLRLKLRAILAAQSQPGVVSRVVLADHLGVSERSVRRWLEGEDRPEPVAQRKLAKWAATISQ